MLDPKISKVGGLRQYALVGAEEERTGDVKMCQGPEIDSRGDAHEKVRLGTVNIIRQSRP